MRARSVEAGLLAKAETIIRTHVAQLRLEDSREVRFQLLEGVASRLGGFDLSAFQRRFGRLPVEPVQSCLTVSRRVIEAIARTGIQPALAVSALAREALSEPHRRSSGAYHTDFRLATHLARRLATTLPLRGKVIDPACGAGMLLTALMVECCGGDRRLTAEWLAEGVHAADLSASALRGSLLSLACLTDDIDALAAMYARWIVGDSLLRSSNSWQELAPGGFDAVIANPPWEKIKLTRHEYLRASGQTRHYGADYDEPDIEGYADQIRATKSYARAISTELGNIGVGETDLFVAFSDLARKLLKPGGEAALLVPAGLIRSKTTEPLRRKLATGASRVAVEVFENRARFFEIDSRFKFLCVHWRARAPGIKATAIELAYGRGTNTGVDLDGRVLLGRSTLVRLRPDLSIPEVRGEEEWQLFCRMSRIGLDWSCPDSRWYPAFMREVDMTRDRQHFTSGAVRDSLPLVEGRMVHQHRFGAKVYVDGTGRSAVWEASAPGTSRMGPQYYIRRSTLNEGARRRAGQMRAGFCDITGQTNERSCLAAIIPPGVACGNKVPTILFPNDPSEDRLWLWIAIANSLPFDWLLRRVITTTINYFHLLSLRLPPIEPSSLPGRQLAEIARALDLLDRSGGSIDALREIADLRARADRLVATAYGLDDADLAIILRDFPLIDRAQPAIGEEARSTVTEDLLFSRARDAKRAALARRRLELAHSVGANAYVPAQSAKSTDFGTGHPVYG